MFLRKSSSILLRCRMASRSSCKDKNSLVRRFSVAPHTGPGPDPRYKSLADQTPRFVTGVLGVALASAVISSVAYFEFIQMNENQQAIEEAQRRKEWEAEDEAKKSFKGSSTAECAPSPKFVEEPVTSTWFPVAVSGQDKGNVLTLVSTSVRCMLNMCTIERARAYAYGLYLSPQAVKNTNGCNNSEEMYHKLFPKDFTPQSVTPEFVPSQTFQGAKPGSVFKLGSKGLGYYVDRQTQSVSNLLPEVMLRLILSRDIAGAHLAKGFDKSMLWRIRKAQNGNKVGSGKNAMKKFTKFFSKRREWDKDTVIDFTRTKFGTLVVQVRDSRGSLLAAEEFDSLMLAWALFDVYLGEKGHMDTTCRRDMYQRVLHLVNNSLEH